MPSFPPSPAREQVVIEVHASSVNFPDTLIIQDKYQFKPALPFSPGAEVASIVKAVGDGMACGKTLFCPCQRGAGHRAVAVLARART